ncbi:hypothetical protein N9159_00555 [bacterium]|nr:hypothetical protein [bacterium]
MKLNIWLLLEGVEQVQAQGVVVEPEDIEQLQVSQFQQVRVMLLPLEQVVLEDYQMVTMVLLEVIQF